MHTTKSWKESFQAFKNRRVLSLALFGFSGGLPNPLILGTLGIWLAECGYSKTMIGFFAIVSATYPLKFVWAPYIDRFKIPFFTRTLGKRRAWIFCTQICVIIGLTLLSTVNPATDTAAVLLLAAFIGLSSASQDVSIEAYRIEILDRSLFGPGAGFGAFGYRIGTLVSGAFALHLSFFFNWAITYRIMACFMLIGMVTTLLNPEPIHRQQEKTPSLKERFVVFESLLYFLKLKEIWALFALIVFYRFNDALIMIMTPQFLLELGYTKVQIANIAKALGLNMMILGGFTGGLLSTRFGFHVTLRYAMIAQTCVTLFFVAQALVGKHLGLLIVTMAVESFSSSLFYATLIGFFCTLCRNDGTAGADYALLSSFNSGCRVAFSIVSGLLAETLGWVGFFLMIFICSSPGIYVIIRYNSAFKNRFNADHYNNTTPLPDTPPPPPCLRS